MKFIQVFKSKKLLFLYIFLSLYLGINLIGGERGLISYFEKKNIEKNLFSKSNLLAKNLNSVENKNKLLSEKIDFDFLDIIYREKFKFGKKDEIIIRLK